MNTIIGIGCIMAGLFGILISFYLTLCFTVWISDIIEQKKWRYWFK